MRFRFEVEPFFRQLAAIELEVRGDDPGAELPRLHEVRDREVVHQEIEHGERGDVEDDHGDEYFDSPVADKTSGRVGKSTRLVTHGGEISPAAPFRTAHPSQRDRQRRHTYACVTARRIACMAC